MHVTLVSRDNFFLFTPMLHEVAASDLGASHIVSPLHKLLKQVDFFRGNVWAVGEGAHAIDPATGKPYPATAQHALRQAKTIARNIVASLSGEPKKPFRFNTLGQMATIGREWRARSAYSSRALWRGRVPSGRMEDGVSGQAAAPGEEGARGD